MFMRFLLKPVVSFLFAWIFLSAISYSTMAQDRKATKDTSDRFDIRNVSFFLPQQLPSGRYNQNVSLQYVVVPKDWTTQDITAPMITYAGKYSLPYGFNLQASLATLFITYRTALGPFWSYSLDHFHFGAGWQAVFNYGFLNQFGFTTVISGWEQQPSLLAGYSFKDMALTLRGDLSWINSIYEKQGGHTVPYTTSFLNGYNISVTLEQRLWKNRVMSFGVKLNNLRFHIIAWPAFPVNQYRYWFPEFQLGLSF
jgi:hypothetical protein